MSRGVLRDCLPLVEVYIVRQALSWQETFEVACVD